MKLASHPSYDGVYRLFVYGTLRSEGHNNSLLTHASLVHSQCELTDMALTMVNLGWFPGLIDRGHTPRIVGELYNIHTEEQWKVLDNLEDVPTLYIPRVYMVNGLKAVVYILSPTYLQNALDDGATFQPIPSGDWFNAT